MRPRIRIRPTSAVSVHALCNATIGERTTWDPKGSYWGAFDGDKLVGFGGYIESARWRDAVYFHASGVAESYRGHRLQRRLIRVRLRHAKKLGAVWAITYTLVHNPASAASLIACGFRPYWPANPWGGRGACYWRRRLNA